MTIKHRIVDQAAFDRAAELLVTVIPRHFNECFQCRQGDRLLDAAMAGKGPKEIRHADLVAASERFCAKGNELTMEFGQVTAAAFGLPWPPA